MEITSWNIRGLGNPFKTLVVKEIIGSEKVDVVFLQEINMDVIDFEKVKNHF